MRKRHAGYIVANAQLEEVAYRQLGLRSEIDSHQEEMVETRDALSERLVTLYMSGAVGVGDVFLLSDDVETVPGWSDLFGVGYRRGRGVR